ncbi:hypothetical protein [Dietzia cercidiphylli]
MAAVAAGPHQSHCLRTDGKVLAAGGNSHGQCAAKQRLLSCRTVV